MQARNHHSPIPAQSHRQAISTGMPPPGMHAPAVQPNGGMQHPPPRSLAPSQGHMARQPRQPIPGQQAPPPPHQQPPPPQQQAQQQQQPPPPPQPPTSSQRLNTLTEDVWMQIGSVAETMNEQDRALAAYDHALRHNPYSQGALTQIANIYRSREDYDKAVEFFQRIVSADSTNGEIWGAIGNCYLMLDELPKAYQAYQQAIIHLPNPKEPKLWYGIGILYDRYGSYEHAEEAFLAVMGMDPSFDKATEIYFRLGIIHKCQRKYPQSLECFNRILSDPPKPLTETDIWFQIGNVHELNSEFALAKDAYERVLRENPQHTKVLQQLGALYFRPNTNLSNIDAAVQLLTSAIELDKDKAEAQTWYLLGRCYMVQQHYNKAYEAYQQAVYRDGNNANYWCSIGVLYYQINQYRDALDAYSRAIRIDPYLSEVWFDLGALYEACNNQVNDAIDAYTRAAELNRSNLVIEQRLDLLRRIQSSGQTSLGSANPPPPPIDPPTATATAGQPNAPGGPAGEAVVAGGVPGVLGAPPMSGAHPQDHAPPSSEGPPGAGAAGRPAQPYGHPSRPMHAQLHHPSQGPSGRPGYADDAAHARYDPAVRGDGPGVEMPPPHYGSSGPPPGGPYAPPQGAYAGAPDMHPSAPHHQPTSRPYSTAGHVPPPDAYAPQGHPMLAGPHRPESGMMDPSHQSPAMHRHHLQTPIQTAYPQSTPTAESRRSPTTFQQGPMNGYAPQHYGPDMRHRSRSPPMAQKSASYRRNSSTRPADLAGRPEQLVDVGAASLAAPDYTRQNSIPTGSLPPRKDLRADDGDVQMEDAQQQPARRASSTRGGTTLAPAAVAVSSDESSTLPPMAAPALAADAAVPSSTPGLSGPTAAPIRLPPVQFSSGMASPGGRSSPLAASGSASRAAAPGNGRGRRGDAGAPLSLASAISAADEDKEGSAINSLMSLSGVASTLTAWPHQPPSVSASPQPSLPVVKSCSESATTAVGRELSTDAPAVTNGVKEMGISSPQNESADVLAATAAPAPAENGARSHEPSPLADRAGSAGETTAVVPSKRSLSRTINDDEIPVPAAPPSPGSAGDSQPSGDGADGLASGGSAAASDADASGDGSWPRKRGRQGSPTPLSEKRPVGSPAADEVGDDEEPEDGEVFEDEVPSGDGGKARKTDDIVMDSGKVAHE